MLNIQLTITTMRICSLLPSTTEIVCALGLENNLVGITHECDYPPGIAGKDRVVFSNIDHNSLSNREIDELVSKNRKEGKSTYLIDKQKFREAKPEIIFTQGLCDVCAVSENMVEDAVEVLGYSPEIISFEPTNLEEVVDSIRTIGEITNKEDEAAKLIEDINRRTDSVREKLANERDRPRVFCLEWLEPPYVAGHWVPQMVDYAGGINGITVKGEPSKRVSWEDIAEFAPNIVLVMPCGFDIEKTMNEIDTVLSNNTWHTLPATKKGEVYILDANSYFSSPGPRLADGIEILARIFHPDKFKHTHPVDSVMNLRNYMHLQSFLG